jgi:hypothetical protein
MFGEDDNPLEEKREDEDSEKEFDFEEHIPDFEFESVEVGEVPSKGEARQQACDHASEHKEFLTEQETRGLNLGGIGGSVGTSTIKIGCKKCEKVYEIEDSGGTEFGVI